MEAPPWRGPLSTALGAGCWSFVCHRCLKWCKEVPQGEYCWFCMRAYDFCAQCACKVRFDWDRTCPFYDPAVHQSPVCPPAAMAAAPSSPLDLLQQELADERAKVFNARTELQAAQRLNAELQEEVLRLRQLAAQLNDAFRAEHAEALQLRTETVQLQYALTSSTDAMSQLIDLVKSQPNSRPSSADASAV